MNLSSKRAAAAAGALVLAALGPPPAVAQSTSPETLAHAGPYAQAPAAVLADRAYDANSLRNHLEKIGAEAVIPSTRSRRAPIPYNPALYRLRNRIERCFNKLKHFRRFATRYDRLTIHYAAFVHLAAAMIWMR